MGEYEKRGYMMAGAANLTGLFFVRDIVKRCVARIHCSCAEDEEGQDIFLSEREKEGKTGGGGGEV